MIYKSFNFRILFLLPFLFCGVMLFAQDGATASVADGKALFKNNCASCHNKNMKDNSTGPALGGVEERWDGREETLYAWIRNSSAVIASGDEYANKIFNDWKQVQMNAFPNLTDVQIESILLYVNDQMIPKDTGGGELGVVGVTPKKEDNTLLYAILLGILGMLAVVLTKLVSNLNYLAEVKAGNAPLGRTSLVDILTSKGVIGFLVFALVIFMGYTTVNSAIDLNRQQGYTPEQPINFSHATHAGIQKIDCQYCHDGARRSKHSVIPAANTCMNCHKAVKKGSKHGTAEISKIYASVGFDPTENVYIENYESLSNEEVLKIYEKWITNEYTKDKGGFDSRGEEEVAAQLAAIESSLTTDVKKSIAGPIPWVRIHNLPDHAYFNHAQHVTVGKQECQTCHGPVEKMDVVYQYSPLSMGWCINCHRQTEVQFAGNEYYESYEKYHKEIKSGKRSGVTVEEIGGLECQKCHY